MPEPADPTVRFELFSSAFCGACHSTRSVLAQAAALVPGAVVEEHDVAFEPDYSEAHDIEATPTVNFSRVDSVLILVTPPQEEEGEPQSKKGTTAQAKVKP